jgi:signal recognition particle receptor subunit beta
MAVLDPHDGYIVMRIVYDGAPLAGKTTSVASLARELGQQVCSPAEFEGRTLFFDWLDYRGGLFEGHKIRCQVISVPGQLTLGARRRRLLQTADSVVFVGESTAAGVAEDQLYLNELSALMRTIRDPPIGVIFQANKRDLPDALPVSAIHEVLEATGMRMAVVESVATQDQGVRDAFVFAIRLALDRVRELLRLGKLRRMRPAVDSGDALLDELLRAEESSATDEQPAVVEQSSSSDTDPLQKTMAAFVLREVIRGEQLGQAVTQRARGRVRPAAEPALPDANVGVGLIWPPVDGRLMLKLLDGQSVTLEKNQDGSWQAVIGEQWTGHSQQWFATLEAGRTALLAWARMHAECAALMSKDRCVALAPDGAGGFRLWQMVRRGPSVAMLLDALVAARGDAATVDIARLMTAMLKWADDAVRSEHALPVSLTSLGGTPERLTYIGLVPTPEALPKTLGSSDDLLGAWLSQAKPNAALHAILATVLPTLRRVA